MTLNLQNEMIKNIGRKKLIFNFILLVDTIRRW